MAVAVTVLACIGASLVLIVGAPLVLAHGRWRFRFPRLALASWYTAFLGGIAAAALGLVNSMAAVAFSREAPSDPMGGWFASTVLVVVGWGGLVAVGGLVALVTTRFEPLAATDRALHQQMALVAACHPSTRVRGVDVTVVPFDRAFAMSIPAPSNRVLVTTALERALTAVEMAAVVEHERTHLRQHHGVIAQLAQLNRACTPGLAGARHLERTTRMLVELIADDAAARRLGAVHTANALVKMAHLAEDESLTLRARRLVDASNRHAPSRRRSLLAVRMQG
ncbi:M56 family metallopeptidase [Frigoribacterium sp. SL97]|uniref:M56 family metallopeptidase n=1 Tax=Frigoribacterium sp. SL97 TaxID=2994664 RepID=UPI0022715A94|nr:M56 family metallopeptidase [Frigoribacterium sp. SL97]WAC50594.1 M48 family metalloprotease [Frigoribacterium sp. SL97]